MIRRRQHRTAAGAHHRIDDGRIGGGDHDRSDRGFGRAPPDLHDHRRVADHRQRFIGQARRGQTGRDENDRLQGFGFRIPDVWRGATGIAALCRMEAGPCNRPFSGRFRLSWRRKLSFLPAEPHQGIEFRMSFEMNKVAGAILVAMIVAMVSGIIASKLVEPTPLKKNAYEVAAAPEAKSSAQTPAGPQPIEPMLATASIEAGKAHTSVCQTCHTFDKGGANKIGPNLYGIVGAPIAEGRDGYAFSDALKAKGKGQTWTVDNLNDWPA